MQFGDVTKISPYRHIIHAKQFNKAHLDELFEEADKYRLWDEERMKRSERKDFVLEDLAGWNVGVCFFEESTRTKMSFGFAAKNLGANASNVGTITFSSMAKGESLEHTVQTLSKYADILIMRFKNGGDAEKAVHAVESQPKPISIINAGDGKEQHPTQALLDLYTIRNHFPKPDKLSVAFVGDVENSRTVHSLVYVIPEYYPEAKLEYFFVSPETSKMPRGVLSDIKDHENLEYHETPNLTEVLPIVNVVYMIRTQTERFKKNGKSGLMRLIPRWFVDIFYKDKLQKILGAYRIDTGNINLMRKDAILLHPLPIDSWLGKEISPEVENDSRAIFMKEQVPNGLYIRMAALNLMKERYRGIWGDKIKS